MEFRALYNQHSKINHSCEPNVMLKHIENSAKIAIIATRKIQIDEEIGFDYTAGRGNVSKISDADERRKILKGLGFKKGKFTMILAIHLVLGLILSHDLGLVFYRI